MNKQTPNRLSRLLKQFANAHVEFDRYLGTITTVAPISLAAWLPAYSSQRKQFLMLSTMTCAIALALLTSKAVVLWQRNGMDRHTTGYVPKSLLWLAVANLALSLATAVIYLHIFNASVTVQSALRICEDHAEDNEFARDNLLALKEPGTLSKKVQIAEGFLLQWHTLPADLKKSTIDSATDVFYGGVLLLLNVVIVVSLQAGLFLLAISNLFIVPPAPPKKAPESVRTPRPNEGGKSHQAGGRKERVGHR